MTETISLIAVVVMAWLLEALQGLLDALARRFPGQPITSSEIFGPAVMRADAAIAKATTP